MALTGLKIQKLLPRTNCKECGSNTCLAFAMKLAAKKVELSLCPYASDEAKRILGAATEPPVRGLKLGPDQGLSLGEETVLYRHERSFVSPTALAVNIDDTAPEAEIEAALAAVKGYLLERVGETFGLDMLSVTHRSGDLGCFVALARRAWESTGKPLVLRSSDPDALQQAALAVKGSRSLLAGVTPATMDQRYATKMGIRPSRELQERPMARIITMPRMNRPSMAPPIFSPQISEPSPGITQFSTSPLTFFPLAPALA